MRRMAFVLLCLLIISSGSCRSALPADQDGSAVVGNLPLEAGQPLDLSRVLETMAAEPPADFDQPLSASQGAEILRQAISSFPAAEILGQKPIDALLEAISELQSELQGSASVGLGRLAAPGRTSWQQGGGCEVSGQKSFEKEGFNGEVLIQVCEEKQDDRMVADFNFSATMQGTTPATQGQEMEVTVTLHGEHEACPSAEGRSTGNYSGRMRLYVKGANTSFSRTTTGLIDIKAANTDDGSLEQADLSFEGSVSFDINGQSWLCPFTSQTRGVNPKDEESLRHNLIGNIPYDCDEPPLSMHLSKTGADAIVDAVKGPLSVLVPTIKAAEENWLKANECVQILITPEQLNLAPGESAEVECEVERIANGEEVNAFFVALPGGPGDKIVPEQGRSSPDSPITFTYTAPEDGSPGSFELGAGAKAGMAHRVVKVGSPLLEWSGTFTMEGSATIPDLGTSQATTTFTIRFQADLNQPPSEQGDDDAQRVLIPFELEEDASMDWSGSATALGTSQSYSGSTSNLITPDYENPEWVFSLPAGDYLAGDGYIDLSEKKLYLFLIGMGDNQGAGTFNLSPATNCSYYHDTATNRVYMVFPLDEEYRIADGSCSDQVSGDLTAQSIRSWQFTTSFVTAGGGGP